jgi:SNF2 family DNA or RNA helicase
LLLIGYDTVRSMQFAVAEIPFGLVIADEAQAIKNPASLRSKALRAMTYDFAVALTGTPIENTWTDLWTICDFATPGRLGPLAEFRDEFPASEDVRSVGERLANTLSSVLIRRTRQSALRGLPPCDVRSVQRPMPPFQALAYRAEANRAGRGPILGLLQGLARISLHPRTRAVLESRDDAVTWLGESARTQVMLDALRTWADAGDAALVFVRSLAAQETLSRALRLAFDLPSVECLNGQRPFAERQRIVGRFQDGDGFRVLLVSPDVGGAGWNFQFACRSVLLERPYNPAVEAQMIARTWRLGQKRPVEVVSPVACLPDMDTFDTVLDGLLTEKRLLSESVLAPAATSDEEITSRFSALRHGDAKTESVKSTF